MCYLAPRGPLLASSTLEISKHNGEFKFFDFYYPSNRETTEMAKVMRVFRFYGRYIDVCIYLDVQAESRGRKGERASLGCCSTQAAVSPRVTVLLAFSLPRRYVTGLTL